MKKFMSMIGVGVMVASLSLGSAFAQQQTAQTVGPNKPEAASTDQEKKAPVKAGMEQKAADVKSGTDTKTSADVKPGTDLKPGADVKADAAAPSKEMKPGHEVNRTAHPTSSAVPGAKVDEKASSAGSATDMKGAPAAKGVPDGAKAAPLMTPATMPAHPAATDKAPGATAPSTKADEKAQAPKPGVDMKTTGEKTDKAAPNAADRQSQARPSDPAAVGKGMDQKADRAMDQKTGKTGLGQSESRGQAGHVASPSNEVKPEKQAPAKTGSEVGADKNLKPMHSTEGDRASSTKQGAARSESAGKVTGSGSMKSDTVATATTAKEDKAREVKSGRHHGHRWHHKRDRHHHSAMNTAANTQDAKGTRAVDDKADVKKDDTRAMNGGSIERKDGKTMEAQTPKK